MAVLPIVEYPDARLRRAAEPVERFDDGLGRLIDDLVRTLAGTSGIGLSAPQVGDSRQVFVVKLDADADAQEYVNPEILGRSGLTLVEERCLSLPGIKANVFRAAEVRIRALDRAGRAFERSVDGLHAVCVQHEMDHLAGRLFTDRLSRLRRLRLRSALAKLERSAAAAIA